MLFSLWPSTSEAHLISMTQMQMDILIDGHYESKNDRFIRYLLSAILDSCRDYHDRDPFIETRKRSQAQTGKLSVHRGQGGQVGIPSRSGNAALLRVVTR
jgi:hypothetical protein